MDVQQFESIKECKNIYAFAFNTKTHERTMYNFNLPYVLQIDKEELVALYKRFELKILIGRFDFSIAVAGFGNTVSNTFVKLLRRIRMCVKCKRGFGL